MTDTAAPEPSDPTTCSGEEGFCPERGFHRHSLKQPGAAPSAPGGEMRRERYAAAIRAESSRVDDVALAEAVIAVADAEIEHLRKERDGFRDQRNGVFATNEQLLAQVQEADLARIRAENEVRTVKREAAAPSAPADRDRIAEIVNRLAAHATGFQDVLDESDRGPWGRLVGGDIDELCAVLAVLPEPRREFDAQAGLQRLADDLHRGEESGDAPDDLAAARETNRRLNYRAQGLESELAAYRRAVSQWEVSERGTYIPHSSLRTIGLASGKDILGSVRHLKHFDRVEQAEAAYEAHRLTLSETLGLGTGAPWHAIYERADDLRRMADETQQAASVEDRCAGCGHWRGAHGDGRCISCADEKAVHVFEPTAEAQRRPACGDPQHRHVGPCHRYASPVREATVEPEVFGPEVVAYRHPTKPRSYLCRQHGDGQPGLTPVEADDLPDGGGCDECGGDVLARQAGEGDR